MMAKPHLDRNDPSIKVLVRLPTPDRRAIPHAQKNHKERSTHHLQTKICEKPLRPVIFTPPHDKLPKRQPPKPPPHFTPPPSRSLNAPRLTHAKPILTLTSQQTMASPDNDDREVRTPQPRHPAPQQANNPSASNPPSGSQSAKSSTRNASGETATQRPNSSAP